MRHRLFVAVALDDASRAACAAVAERLRGAGFAARYVLPENYHLTVAFLGGVDEERVAGVAAAVGDAAANVPRFAMTLARAGAFPDARRAKVAWLGPAAPVPAFGTLCGVVRSALVARGFSFDRDADPHVTLGRADGRTRLPEVAAPPIPVDVAALTLFRSRTEPAGARYEALERYTLGPRSASPS